MSFKYVRNFVVIIIPIFTLNLKIFSIFSVVNLNLINNNINNDSSSFIEIIRINNGIQFYIVVKILFIAEKKYNRYVAINAYRTNST